MSEETKNVVQLPNTDPRTCDVCSAGYLHKSMEQQTFKYGIGEEAVSLSVLVPLWKCDHCDHSYTDGEAEDLRHAAVCNYLKVLSPGAICELRKGHGLSQEEFANLTGFGLASIKRWETGAVIQNIAADRFLRLLFDQAVFGRLIALVRQPINSMADSPGRTRDSAKFISPLSDNIKREAQIFTLRPRNRSEKSICMS